MSRNICAFKPRPHLSIQESLTRWINGYLSWRIRDLYRREDRNLCSLDSPSDHSSDENPPTLLEKLTETGFVPPQLSGIDGYIEQVRRQERQDQLGQLERYVLDDPQGILKGCCHPKYPKCNCQFLSLRLLFKEPPERLADISREFNIDRQIITYHWKRKCKPLLQAILKSQGYSGDEE